MGLLDKCPTEQQFHPSTKAIWMIVITLGKAFLEYSPLSELLAPRPVAVHGTVSSERNGSGASSQHKRQRSALCKAQGDMWPMRRQTRAMEQAPIFPVSHPDGCYETRKHDVPESVCDDETMLVDHANPFMSEPQLLLGALLIPGSPKS